MPHTEEQHASDQQVYGASLTCIPVPVQAAGILAQHQHT
jgi:hypothetical protein